MAYRGTAEDADRTRASVFTVLDLLFAQAAASPRGGEELPNVLAVVRKILVPNAVGASSDPNHGAMERFLVSISERAAKADEIARTEKATLAAREEAITRGSAVPLIRLRGRR
jgi:hypothetical protein